MKARIKRMLLAVTSGMLIISASADTLVVPNGFESTLGPGSGLSLPFRDAGARWQQFYISSQFDSASSDQIQITGLRFRVDEGYPVGTSFSTVAHGVSIFMSTSLRTHDTASSTFSENYGPDLFEVLPPSDLTLAGTKASATSFDVIIPLPNGYVYDRTKGNLLVDIRVAGTSVAPFLDQVGDRDGETFGIGGVVSAPIGTISGQGLVTQFVFSPIPEPSTLLLLLGGVSLIVLRKGIQ